jgi:anti-sigma B factor antagonist
VSNIERHMHGEATVISLSGEVDLSWSQDVRRALLDALKSGGPLGVDLSQVSYIDSSGIAALVEGFQQARHRGGRFALIAVSDSVRAVLDLARLDRVFPMVAGVDALGGGSV